MNLPKGFIPVIPLKLYQTYHIKENLPPKMQECMDSLKNQNPEFEYELFDDDDCRNFIEDNFPIEIVKAFDALIPGAYKADLFRACILYIQGGIYLDNKLNCINGFKLIELTNREHIAYDYDNKSIWNAVMVFKPENQILMKYIKRVVENIKSDFYGDMELWPTGPRLLGLLYEENKNLIDNIELFHVYYWSQSENRQKNGMKYKDKECLMEYKEYREEKKLFGKTEHYGDLWKRRCIYDKNIKFD